MKNIENQVQILLNKLKIGDFDDVIIKTKKLLKEIKHEQILFNILSIAYQSKGENDKSIKMTLLSEIAGPIKNVIGIMENKKRK